MSLADRLKQRNLEREVSGKHPLIAMGLDRGTRDAYFRGIVLAAFLDDGKVDESERAYLRRVGLGLDLPDAEVADMISSVGELRTEDDQLALLEEISALIGKSAGVVKLFLSEFSLVWRSHSANNAELETYRTEIARMIGVDIPDAFWREFDAIFNDQAAAVKVGRALEGFGPNEMAYLFPKYAGKQMATSVGKTALASASESVAKRSSDSKSVRYHMRSSHCDGCGNCLDYCSTGAIIKTGRRYAIDESRCDQCGACSYMCPKGAIVKEEAATNGEYCIILEDCGPNLNTIVDLISDIPGIRRAVACKIVTQRGGRLPVTLSHEEATKRQMQLKQMGASVDVVKA